MKTEDRFGKCWVEEGVTKIKPTEGTPELEVPHNAYKAGSSVV